MIDGVNLIIGEKIRLGSWRGKIIGDSADGDNEILVRWEGGPLTGRITSEEKALLRPWFHPKALQKKRCRFCGGDDMPDECQAAEHKKELE